jgi:hypothetical protein
MDNSLAPKLRVQDLLESIANSSGVVIYGYGIAGRWLAAIAKKRGNFLGFIDSDIKKVRNAPQGEVIFHVSEAHHCFRPDISIVISVADIQDVYASIKSMHKGPVFAMGLFLSDARDYADTVQRESTDYLVYALDTVRACHEAFHSQEKIFLRSIDVIITEKCTLRCKDCSNLMQYYQAPKDVDQAEIKESLTRLLERVSIIHEVRVIGGEPMMNKAFSEIIQMLIEFEQIENIVVFSNAMIPPKAEHMGIYRNPKVVFSLTDYGALSRNTQRFTDVLNAHGVVYRINPPENWTDSGVIANFDRTDQENREVFEKCCGKNLITLSDEKVYRCPFAANADRLKAIPRDERNYVKVDASADDIRTFLTGITHTPACNFCKGRSFDAEHIEPAIQAKNPIYFAVMQ